MPAPSSRLDATAADREPPPSDSSSFYRKVAGLPPLESSFRKRLDRVRTKGLPLNQADSGSLREGSGEAAGYRIDVLFLEPMAWR